MPMRTAARGVAIEMLNDPKGVDANRAMFRALISGVAALRNELAVIPLARLPRLGRGRYVGI